MFNPEHIKLQKSNYFKAIFLEIVIIFERKKKLFKNKIKLI